MLFLQLDSILGLAWNSAFLLPLKAKVSCREGRGRSVTVSPGGAEAVLSRAFSCFPQAGGAVYVFAVQ